MTKYKISSSPHMLSGLTTSRVMWGVVAALIPALAASVYFFRILAVKLVLVCVAGSVLTELVIRKLRGKKITVSDGSAVVTGLLLAMVLPPALPAWIAVVGSIVSIGLAKELFGGLGYTLIRRRMR